MLICSLSSFAKLYLKHSVACVNLNKSTCNRVKTFEANFLIFQQTSTQTSLPKDCIPITVLTISTSQGYCVELLFSIQF